MKIRKLIMLVTINHRLNEDFIEEIPSEDVVIDDNDNLLSDSDRFVYNFQYCFKTEKILKHPEYVTGLFNKIYHCAHTLRHIEKCLNVKVTIVDPDNQFSQEPKDYTPASFACYIEMMCQQITDSQVNLRQMDYIINVEFVPEKVSFKQYVKDYMRIIDICIKPYTNITYTGIYMVFVQPDTKKEGIGIQMFSSYFVGNQSQVLQKVYNIIYDSDEDYYNSDRETYNRLTYRSQRMPIVSKLVFLRDNPDMFRGYRTIVDGFIQSSGTDAENFFHLYLYLTAEPRSLRYESKDSFFSLGRKFIDTLTSIERRQLHPNLGQPTSYFKVFIHVPETVSGRLEEKSEDWIYREMTDDNVCMMVVLYNDEFEYYDDGWKPIIVGKDSEMEMKRLHDQFDFIYNKEKTAEKSDRR